MAVKAKQQYYADETTIKKEAREFGMIDELKDKLDSIEYGAQVNIIEEVQENGVPLEIVDKSVNVLVPEVIDNLYTIDPNNSLSAKQGKILYDMIKNLLARGRFLSTWNTATGLPVTNPEESPYEYKAGDYYIVGIVAAEGGTNFRPEPGEYVINVASDEQETSEVHVSDIYVYDGENWVLLINSTRELAVDDYVDYTYQSTNPVENQAIAKEFVKKQNKFYTVSTTQPSNPVEGDEWYDATNDKVFYWDGTQWKEMGGGSTYTAGLHISIDPNDNNKISVVEWSATSSALGLVKLGSDTPQNVAPNNVSSKSNRTYRIQANNSGQLMVNVPWEDTTYISGTGISISNNRVISCTVKPVTVGPTAPSTPGTGDLWYDTNKNTMFLYKNNSWTIIGPEIYPITKADYDALTPAEQGDGRFFLITDNDGTIYVDWDNVQNRPMYIGATAPSNPCEGYIWYDTTNDVLKVYDGTQWNEVGGGGGCCYTAGNGIDISNDEISIDTTVVATKTDLNSKQDTLTAGANITIAQDGTISATDTTYTAGDRIDITNNVISADKQFEVVDTLPAVAQADVNKVYILGPIGSGADKYEEYIVQDAVEGHFESASTITSGTYSNTFTGFDDYLDLPSNTYMAVNNLNTTNVDFAIVGDGDTSSAVINLLSVSMPYAYDSLIEYPQLGFQGADSSIDSYVSIDYYTSSSPITWVAGTPKQYVKIGETSPDLSGKQDKATSGSGAPSTTPSYIGQMYIDTTNDNLYVATGTSSSSDWTAVDTNTTYTAGDGIDISNNEISVDASDIAGTGLTVSNNNLDVDSTVVALKSDLTNYYTKTETYTKTEVDNLISSFGNFEVVASLPSVSTASEKTIYLLGPIGTGADKYEEWIVTETYTGAFESESTIDHDFVEFSGESYIWNNDKSIRNKYIAINNLTISGPEYVYIDIADDNDSERDERVGESDMPYIYQDTQTHQKLLEIPYVVTDERNSGSFDIYYSNSEITWNPRAVVTKNWTKIGETSVDLSGYATTTALTNGLATKQDTLVSGTNIKTINNESLLGSGNITISAPTYTAGDGIDITDNEISVNTDVIQEKLTAGDGITIENVCTDISDMQGPAPDGFHVPLNTEWQAMYDIWTALGGGSSDGTNFGIALKLPLAGNRFRGSSSVSDQGAYGRYRSSTRTNASNAYSIHFDSSVISPQTASQRSNGLSVRCFKNSPIVPTPSWTKLYGMSIESGGIFWSSTDGLISLSSNGQTWVTIMDKNLGATTVWNSGDTLSEANCGKYYQRGNNYGFPRTGTVTTSSTQVDASAYGPGNYYSSSTFITRSSSPYRWDTTDNANLRGGVSQGSSQECALTISSDTTVLATKTDLSGKQDKATSGSTAPSTTPSYIGQQYVDTTNDKMYVATGTSSSSDWTEVGAGSGDMLYSDFGWETLTGASVTLALRGEITPSANFTVNKPNDLKDGQFYVLRVDNGATAYTMTLGTGVTNPYSEDLTLVANNIQQFMFLAKGGNLELQPSTEIDISGKQDKATSGSTAPSTTPSYIGQQYVDTTNDKLYVATGTTSSSDWTEVGAGGGGNVIAMTQAEYNALTIEEKNDGKLRIITDAPTEDISVDWANIANKPIELSTQSGNTLTSLKIWVGSQTDYEALATKDASTLYFTTNVVS